MDITINGKNAKTTWGIVFDTSAISALMTPAPVKDRIEDSSRLEHGKRVVATSDKLDARTNIQLTFTLHAANETEFFTRYDSFCSELESGAFNIIMSSRPTVAYKCLYKSCRQFTQYNNRLAKFSLTVEEPNPKDRNIN